MGTVISKKDLAKRISARYGNTQAAAMDYMSAIFQEISDSLRAGDSVYVHGFGTFRAVDVAARDRQNPRNGETVHCPAKRRAAFRASKRLME